MVSTRQKRQTTGARSMYNRIMRLVVPIIMGTFLIIGLVLLFGLRANSQDTLTQSRHQDITDFLRGINTELQRRVDSLSGLATERDAREFARDTLVNTTSTTINDSQTRLLGDFTGHTDPEPSCGNHGFCARRQQRDSAARGQRKWSGRRTRRARFRA